MKNIQILFIFTLLLLVFACKKGEQGNIGPAGIAGTKGTTGDKGDVGITNSKGMLVSSWVEVKPADWVVVNNTQVNAAFTLASLTADIANKGNVYFYMQPSGASYVYPMPYSESNGAKFYGSLLNSANTQGFILNYGFIPQLGSVKLTTNYKFRLVIIPAAARIAAGIDWENYDSVKNYLNLND
jgi:hypothetical protein